MGETPSATPTRRRRADVRDAQPVEVREVPVLDMQTRTSSTSDSAHCSPLPDGQELDEELRRFSQFGDPREPHLGRMLSETQQQHEQQGPQSLLGRMQMMQIKGKSVDTTLSNSPRDGTAQSKNAKTKKGGKRRSMKIRRKFSSALLRRSVAKLSSTAKSPSSPRLMSPRKAVQNRKFSHLSDRSTEAISDLSSAASAHGQMQMPPRTNPLKYTKSAGNVLLSDRDAVRLKKRQSQSMHNYNARVMDPPPSFLKPRSTSFSATPYRARSTSTAGVSGVTALKDRSKGNVSSASKAMQQKRRSVHYVPKGPRLSRFSMKRTTGTTPLSQ